MAENDFISPRNQEVIAAEIQAVEAQLDKARLIESVDAYMDAASENGEIGAAVLALTQANGNVEEAYKLLHPTVL